ncbi:MULTISPECIES: AAA family ATPase [Fusobacterium]|uniref:AAA family ATPase n=1 Tax=Fusobacterium TaxID=848 RepID=UPI001F27A01E|nr:MULTISPECIES: AAA family ATPase [Fusobacterium]MCF2613298.1 AAA family ATPase [Fusobacterium perfoetens]
MKINNTTEKIIINNLGPLKSCKLYIKDFMIFTGQQASGKSTIAKSIFFFKNIKIINISNKKTNIFFYQGT